ncbi:hypothetical protein LTS17_011156 [Exophiala oligosperma]
MDIEAGSTAQTDACVHVEKVFAVGDGQILRQRCHNIFAYSIGSLLSNGGTAISTEKELLTIRPPDPDALSAGSLHWEPW